jgi:hypothetical protein
MIPRLHSSLALLAALALLSGCRTYQKTVSVESLEIEKMDLTARTLGFDEIERSYADGKKTVRMKPVYNCAYAAQGFKVTTVKTRYIAWDPLTELVEIPQGAVEIVFLPLSMLFNVCTKIYMTDYEENTPWRKTLLPIIYKISPITGDRRTIIGRRSISEEILSRDKKPAPPWEEKRAEPANARLVSIAPAPDNRLKLTVHGSSQNPDGVIEFVFSVGEDPKKQHQTRVAFLVTLEIADGRSEVRFETWFDNIHQEY